jgi:hypothetical protein
MPVAREPGACGIIDAVHHAVPWADTFPIDGSLAGQGAIEQSKAKESASNERGTSKSSHLFWLIGLERSGSMGESHYGKGILACVTVRIRYAP